MTHTLHRRGTAESLSGDYALIMLRAMGINDRDYLPKVKECLRIALRHNPANAGSEMKGCIYEFPPEEIIAEAKGDTHIVFDNPKALVEFLKEVKEADLGLSLVVSGIFENVDECLEQAGLKHHTGNFSLGIWGNTQKLPSDDILEVTTMCGHGLISTNLVKVMVKEIKTGTKMPEEAAKILAPNCTCGIFNPTRAAKLLAGMAGK